MILKKDETCKNITNRQLFGTLIVFLSNMKVRKYLNRLIGWIIVLIVLEIYLGIRHEWIGMIGIGVIFYGMYKMAFELAILTFKGDFTGNLDLSYVSKTWVQIPSTQTSNPFYWAVIYRQKSDPNSTKPYIIVTHGMGSALEDLELIAAPLAMNGYHVISFNQTGHGFYPHRTSGNGKDYTLVMTNVNDIVNYTLQQPDLAYDADGTPRIGFLGGSTGRIMALTHAYANPKIKMIIALSQIHDFMALLATEDNFSLFSKERLFRFMLKSMKVKLDYTEAENKIISPHYFLHPDPSNKNRVFMVHCEDDPLPFSEAMKSKALAELPDENCLFLKRGGHGFRAQETILSATISRWLREKL